MDPVRLAESLAVMGALEALAGELACVNATEPQVNEVRALHYEMLAYHARGDLAGYFKFNQAIHLKIVKYSGNAVLYNIYRQMNGNVRRARYMANLSKERWDAAVREHEAILAALSARDVKRIKVLLSDHLAHKLSSVLAELKVLSARQAA
jgi:DNA-binding GntR family transcriptional regulator